MHRDDNLAGDVTIWRQIVMVQDGRWSGGEMYPMLGTVDSTSIFHRKKKTIRERFSEEKLGGSEGYS